MAAWQAARDRPLLAAQCLLDLFESSGKGNADVFAELFGGETKPEDFEPSPTAERKANEEAERELRRQAGAMLLAEAFWNWRSLTEKLAGLKMQIQVIPNGR